MPRIVFVSADGRERSEVEARVGDTLLDVAHEHSIDIEGACEGNLSCSTCHVIVEPSQYALLPEPSEEEEDMLDLAFGLQPTSRLGCQIVVTEAFDGLVLRLPPATRNLLLS